MIVRLMPSFFIGAGGSAQNLVHLLLTLLAPEAPGSRVDHLLLALKLFERPAENWLLQ